MNEKPATGRQAFYAALYPALVEAARAQGYALLIHGSMARDLDLVAVPWEETCAETETLAAALALTCGGMIAGDGDGQAWAQYDDRRRSSTRRPHGRICYTINLAGSCYVDLSVIEPRRRPVSE